MASFIDMSTTFLLLIEKHSVSYTSHCKTHLLHVVLRSWTWIKPKQHKAVQHQYLKVFGLKFTQNHVDVGCQLVAW